MLELPWMLFVSASVAVIIAPGQDMVLVFSRSLAQGAAAGVSTATGVSCGLLLHASFVTLGLGAIVQASAHLFFAIKILGAAYLVYLGVSLLLAKPAELSHRTRPDRSLLRLFFDGAVSNLANPKILVFYLAFLPQFVAPDMPNPTLAVFTLGVTFAILTFLIKGPVGYFAGKLSRWFRENPNTLRWIYRCSGFALVGMAVRLALGTSET